ncbi:MAG: AAA family ATPase, partial [Marinobacter sp.]|nr:AAA family ATPase [Marinobacter sp.]
MLLTTKFLKPAPDPRAVKRERLLDLLAARPAKRLNLVVAPAGFGKTTLVNQWCERLDAPVAWLALDRNDNEPRRFWQYVAGALAHSGAAGIEDSQQQLNSHEVHELDGAITALLNALAADPQPARVLVLDDYHLIEDPKIHRQLAYFLDYLPPGMVLAITSRVEPELPIARWRVRQWVDEVHPQMLAFSEEETKRFFEDYMDLSLSADAAHKIWAQTEGWVAAMQLAALSGQNSRNQTPDDVSPIHVDSRQISDYVLTEILDQQPPEVRRFLLDTACCPRLNASLCDAVREAGDSQEMLELLTRRNLFLIPLDTRNEWFRYHDLFREALYQRISQSEPDKVTMQQTHAVTWLLEHDNIQEGISQIVQSRDWGWLARVLEQHGNNLIHAGFHLPVLDWLGQLPPDELQNSPSLLMLRIWALFFANRVDRIQLELEHLETLLANTPHETATDTESTRGLRSEISLIRSYLARSRSDDKSASDLTRQVLKDIDHTRIPLKSVTYYGLGLDYFGRGDLLPAEDALRSAVSYGQVERKASTVLSSGGLLAWIQFNRGELELALETCTSVRAWIDQHHS